MPKIIDISLPISPNMPNYPGTAATKITSVKSVSGSATMSEIAMTSHAGTHIDAPSHAIADGAPIDSFDLELFVGPCRVLDLTACDVSIGKAALEAYAPVAGERILFKTANSLRGYDKFYEDYVYLEPEAAQYLSEIGVSLIGIDCLSVKQRGASDNTAHTALLSKGIPILEGIDLSQVTPGEYALSALPLAFNGIDGAPARAVVISNHPVDEMQGMFPNLLGGEDAVAYQQRIREDR